MSREVELGCESWTSFASGRSSTAVQRTFVVARFVTTARFVTNVTKSAAMPARFVTIEVVTNRAGFQCVRA